MHRAQQPKCRVCARELHLNTVIGLHSTMCAPYQFVSFARVASTVTAFHCTAIASFVYSIPVPSDMYTQTHPHSTQYKCIFARFVREAM